MFAVLFAGLVLAQPNVPRYSMTVTDASRLTATVAVDIDDRKQTTEGRASVVFLPQPNPSYTLKSYPVFNGTFQLSYPSAASLCTFTQGARMEQLFDWSSNGWLSSAMVSQMPNGDALYSLSLGSTLLYVPTMQGQLAQYSLATVSALIANGDDHPYSLNVTVSGYNYAQWLVSNFSTKVTPLHSADWAPPPDSCIVSKLRCPTGSVVTMDVYRSHDNSSYAHVLENANTATAAGEWYFACHLSPGPYITHFQVRLSTAWNAYSECNQGYCSFSVPGASPATYGILLGVGREESLGNNMGDGTGQCDTPAQDPGIGYWLSMNVAGQCPFGKKVGDNNCTWEASYKAIKTIDMTCSGVLSNCQTTDWMTAGAKLEAAFQSCPAVNALDFGWETPYAKYLRETGQARANARLKSRHQVKVD